MFNTSFSMRKLITLLLAAALLIGGWGLAPALAASDTPAILLTADETKIYSDAELDQGKRLFNRTCARCHVGGQTYPNPDVSLRTEDLENATPRRDTVMAMVDYLKNPTTYDGMDSLVEYHPNTQLTSEYPRMRFLSDEDLEVISAYVLVQAETLPGWGGTKSETHSDLAGYL